MMHEIFSVVVSIVLNFCECFGYNMSVDFII